MSIKSSVSWFTPFRLILIVLAASLAAAAAFYFWPRAAQPSAGTSSRQVPQANYWPTNGWQTTSPESQGLFSGELATVLSRIQENNIPIHSWMVTSNGYVLLDAYFYPYDGSILHDMGSATKSITTTLIGIAVDRGFLSMADTMLSFFPDRAVANLSEWKQQITVRDLVTMSSGLHCDDKGGSEWTQDEMRASDDWVQFVLDLEAIHEPGTVFAYCSPGSHMLSAILTQATGMSELEFAKEYLFAPLGIQQVYWPVDADGNNYGWGDLAMFPRDMAKIGYLWLNEGAWDGQQIISKEWVHNAITKQIGTDRGQDYGYGLWLNQGDPFSYMASGRNGQEIQVVPALGLVMVKTGGGYEPNVIDRYLITTIGDLENGMADDPAGQAQLQEAVAAMLMAPASEPVLTLPAIAEEISGKQYSFGDNGLFESTLSLTFLSPEEAQLEFTIIGEPAPRVTKVGLDGLYRTSLAGKPAMARGEWLDDQTFSIQYNEGPGLNFLSLTLRFEGDQILAEIAGLGSFEGTAQ